MVIAGVLLLLSVGISYAVGEILGHKLIGLLQERLNAEVNASAFFYLPPYGLSARNCRIQFRDSVGNQNDLLDIRSLRVTLAELPMHGGPLVIQDITVRQPAIHLIHTFKGFEGQSGLFRPDDHPLENHPRHKLSEILQLRHFAIAGGQVVYEDRTLPQSPSMVWSGIDVRVDTSASGPADYQFKFAATNSDLAQFKASGTFNVDNPSASVEQFSLSATPDADQGAHSLPPQLADVLQKHRVRGILGIHGSAVADRQNPSRNELKAVLTLAGASAISPELDASLDELRLVITAEMNPKAGNIKLTDFTARSGNSSLSMTDGLTFTIDRDAKTWSLQNMDGTLALQTVGATSQPSSVPDILRVINPRGALNFTGAFTGSTTRPFDWVNAQGEVLVYPRKMSVQPEGFPLPISDITGGPLRIAGGVLAAKDVLGHYGNNQMLFNSARLALAPLSHADMNWTEIASTIVFAPPAVEFPPPLDEVAKFACPSGEFAVSGRFFANFSHHKPVLDYDLLVSCDHASAQIANNDVRQIKADAELLPDHFQIIQANAQALGGTVEGAGRVDTQQPYAFSGSVFAHRASVAQLAHLLKTKQTEEMKLEGLASAQASVSGSGPDHGKTAEDLLKAEGKFEIYQGNLWDIPVIQKIEKVASIARQALTVGQAAAFFRVANRRVELQNAAVSAPVLGLQGSGIVDFDGNLDLHVIAAPLADWRKKLRKTGIPFVSSVVGDVAGTVQEALNGATGSLFYDMHVTGSASDPQVKTEPFPALTEGATRIIKNMLQQTPEAPPLNLLQNEPEPQTKK